MTLKYGILLNSLDINVESISIALTVNQQTFFLFQCDILVCTIQFWSGNAKCLNLSANFRPYIALNVTYPQEGNENPPKTP